ncbi:unnamed protein product, partial [Scytosiphon promiscuus]
MSVDPLDAVGQGHTWYGYNLALEDESEPQGGSSELMGAAGSPRRTGRLMADHLFGGSPTQAQLLFPAANPGGNQKKRVAIVQKVKSEPSLSSP